MHYANMNLSSVREFASVTVNKFLKLVSKDIFVQKGVHPDDLEQFLRTINKLDQIEDGKISCESCNKTLSKQTIGKISKIKGDVRIFCDNYVCYVENNLHSTKTQSDQKYLDLAKLSDNIEVIEVEDEKNAGTSVESSKNSVGINSD